MADEYSRTSGEPKIFNVLREDLRRADFERVLRRDFKELKEFMLTEERQKQLKDMGRLKRWFILAWWLLKSLILKLTPLRRLLVVLGIVLLLIHVEVKGDTQHYYFLGGLVLLFVLMLELKDKLIAQRELEAGRAVQNALMPERSPRVLGWNIWLFTRSANEVGGDLVDFVQMSESRFGVAVGDVAGKGLRAALLSAKLQASLRALAPDATSLGELAAKLNHIFCRDSLPNLFASIFYLEVQPDSGAVRSLNAGHIPPLLLRGTEVEKLEKGGVALGILPSATFVEQRVELQTGNVLLVYSDGLTEARNEEGMFFGEQHLLDLVSRLTDLPAEQIGDRIVAEIDRFVGEARANDDLSIAIVRRL